LSFKHNINYFSIRVITIEHQFKKNTVPTGQENNLPHHFITVKDWYIHVVVLHTQISLRYRLVHKEKGTYMHVDFTC
jgi:hypothetical protein